MPQELVLRIVTDSLGSGYREVKFLRQPFEDDPVKKPAPNNLTVPLIVNPFVNKVFNLGPGQVIKRSAHDTTSIGMIVSLPMYVAEVPTVEPVQRSERLPNNEKEERQLPSSMSSFTTRSSSVTT